MVARLALVAAACAVLAGPQARAQNISVRASVDRASIRENESFTFSLRVEGPVRDEPDVTPLERDFDILSTSTSTRIQIVNGQTQQIAEWQYQLIPNRAGTIEIPPIEVAGIASNALSLDVMPAAAASSGAADIFMEVEADPEQAYVQSQIIFTLRLFIGIGTGRATLTAPAVDGVEAIVERLGEDNQYQTVRDGRNFIVRERRYAVFPQRSGKLTIGPVTFEAMVIPSRGFSRVQRFRSDAVEVDVLAAVAPPAGYPDAVWLPAKSLRLEERWSDGDMPLQLGIPQTRTLTIAAEGLLETQLPSLTLQPTEGVRQYADQPELDRELSNTGLDVRRTERYAVIAQQEGDLELAPIELPWWNVTTRRWEVATLPARTISVLPSTESFVEPETTSATAPAPVVEPTSSIWKVVSIVLGIGWMSTAIAWWWSVFRTSRAPRARRASHPRFHADRKIARALLKACNDNDAVGAQALLLQWAALRFPEDPPNTLGAVAATLPEAAAAAVAELESHLYGRQAGAWDGAALAGAFKALQSVARGGADERRDALLPLYR
jgi:BatD DUF11 like domain